MRQIKAPIPTYLRSSALLSFVLMAVFYSVPASASAYGIYGTASGFYSIGPDNHNLYYSQNYTTNTFLPVAYFAGPSLGSSGSITYNNGHNVIYTASGSYVVGPWVFSNGYERVLTGTQAVNLDPQGSADGNAQVFMYWTDQIIVGGLPAGTPVVVQMTNVLDSGILAFGSFLPQYNFIRQTAGLSDGHHSISIQLLNPSSKPHLHLQSSNTITTAAGRTLTFTLQLLVSNDSEGVSEVTMDALDTAFANIQPLTTGAILTSASGIDYSTLSETPEPSSILLLGAGIAGTFGLLRKSRANP